MGRLIYTLNVSLDGYVEALDGSIDWGSIDDELLGWFVERAGRLGASLYGRRLYETMSAYWPTADTDPNATPTALEFHREWLRIPKFVVSSTLTSVDWNSRLVAGDVGEILAQVREAVDGDIEVGGATLASAFVRRGLVDRYEVVSHPVILGGGKPYLPPLDDPIRVRLTDTRGFTSGVIVRAYERV